MSNSIELAKKYASVITVVLGIIGTGALLIGQQRILQGMGVVYEETLDKVVSEQKTADVIQNIRIEKTEESIQAHSIVPGHGVGIERSINMKYRIESLEVKTKETDTAVIKLSIATAQLAEQTKILAEQIRQMRHE